MARVTIGLPVYNGENFVGHAIQSVLDQTYSDWVLIISDNASTDRTREICESFAAQEPRIQYHRSEQNRGAAWNFNQVFRLSRTEYFRWLSHDDYLMPRAIERCLEELEARPEIVSCSTATGALDSDGFRILDDTESECDLGCQGLTESSESQRLKLATAKRPSDRYRGILLYSRRCNEVYGVVRRDIMAKTQLHPNYCGGEKVFLAELALHGPIFEIPELLFYVRWHTARFTSNDSIRDQDQHMATHRKAFTLPHQYRATLGYLELIPKVGMPWFDRVLCLLIWMRFTFQVKKWGMIVRNTLSGNAALAEIEGKTKSGERVHEELRVPVVPANGTRLMA